MGFAELPAAMVAAILNLEFLVHAWDFSKALGADLNVSDALTDYVEVLAQQTISDQVRAGGSFAPPSRWRSRQPAWSGWWPSPDGLCTSSLLGMSVQRKE